MDDLRKLFGSSLRRCRRARGLTQAQLADATDLSLEMIGRMERGQTAPSFETISALASVLGVRVSALFGAEARAVEGDRGQYLDRIDRLLVQMPDKELRRVERVLVALLTDDSPPR